MKWTVSSNKAQRKPHPAGERFFEGGPLRAILKALSHYAFNHSPYSSHLLMLGHFPPADEPRRVLDVGCGNSYLGAILAARGYTVVGIERPGGWTEIPPGVRLIEADLDCGLPAIDGVFDAIVCGDVLEHVRHPDLILRQLGLLLAPGGVIVASLPNSGNLYFRLVVLSGRFPKQDKGLFDRTHIHFYTFDGWRNLFTQTGLVWRSVEPSAIPLSLRFESLSHSRVMRWADTLCYLLARLWTRLFAYQFIVVAAPR